MEGKTLLYIIIPVFCVLSIAGICLSQNYYYKLVPEVTIDDVMAIILNYALLAALIERFSNKVVLRKLYFSSIVSRGLIHKSDMTLKEIGRLDAQNNSIENLRLINAVDSVEEHDKSFSWLSFMLAFAISSFGFRFFINIFCASDGTDLNMFIDIFLTSILLSGGAQYIKSIMIILSPTNAN